MFCILKWTVSEPNPLIWTHYHSILSKYKWQQDSRMRLQYMSLNFFEEVNW